MRDKGSGWRRRRSCRFIWPDMRWLRHRPGSGVQILHRKLEHEALLYALFVCLLFLSCLCSVAGMRGKGSGWRRRRSCRFIWPDMRWLRHRAGSGVQILHRETRNHPILYFDGLIAFLRCPT